MHDFNGGFLCTSIARSFVLGRNSRLSCIKIIISLLKSSVNNLLFPSMNKTKWLLCLENVRSFGVVKLLHYLAKIWQ